jgi:hypothetical protein
MMFFPFVTIKRIHNSDINVLNKQLIVYKLKDFKYIEQASDFLKTISEKEKTAMELLATI